MLHKSALKTAVPAYSAVDAEMLEKEGKEALEAKLKHDVFVALEKLPTYKQVTKVIIRDIPFVKTTTNKIRRAKDGSPM